MSDIDTPQLVASPSPRSRVTRLRRPVGLAAASILALGTIYLAVMTVLWWTHTSLLQEEVTTLGDDLVARDVEIASTNELLIAARADLDAELERGIGLANSKAQGEDYTLFYADVAVAMADCASEMGEVVEVTYNRDVYVAWTVKRYENEVAGFCAEVASAVTEIDADFEEALQ